MKTFEEQLAAAGEWLSRPRFAGIVRLHTARQVAEQQGSIETDYRVAREAAPSHPDGLASPLQSIKAFSTGFPHRPPPVEHARPSGEVYSRVPWACKLRLGRPGGL